MNDNPSYRVAREMIEAGCPPDVKAEIREVTEGWKDAMPPCERIQRSRRKGWKMPPNTVYVGRPSKWGNPTSPANGQHITLGPHQKITNRPMTVEECVERFREDVMDGSIGLSVEEIRQELRGKNLACWCRVGSPCHGDVLLEIANG